MKHYPITFIALAVILLSSTVPLNAQIGRLLDRMKDELVQDLEREVTDAITERLADEIANRAVRKVNTVLDSMFQSSYENDTLNYGELARSYDGFLTAMNESADLPDDYRFDILLEVEITDYDNAVSSMNMMLSKSQSIVGIEQINDGEKSDIVIVDLENDIVAIYNIKEKRVQALPNMMMMGTTPVSYTHLTLPTICSV